MKKYELLLTLPGTLDDQGVEEEMRKVLEIIKNYNQEPEVNKLGKIRLAYPIKQIRYGYFYSIVFAAEPKDTLEINKKLRLNHGLLRAILSNFDSNKKTKQKLGFVSQSVAKTKVKEKVSLEDIMEDKKEEVKPKSEAPTKESKVDLNDIDKKLDEILDSTNIVPGV